MKIKLLRKFHKQWRHKITEDGKVILLDDIKNIGLEFQSIHNFMEQYFVNTYYAETGAGYYNWLRRKNNINRINKQKRIYNENK